MKKILLSYFISILLHVFIFVYFVKTISNDKYKKQPNSIVTFFLLKSEPVVMQAPPVLKSIKTPKKKFRAKSHLNTKFQSSTKPKKLLKTKRKIVVKKEKSDPILQDIKKLLAIDKQRFLTSPPSKNTQVTHKIKKPSHGIIKTKTPSPSSNKHIQAIEAHYKSRLHRIIQRHKRYPNRAKRKGEEGKVVINFTILPSGQIQNINISIGSGSASLDNATIKILKKISGKLPFPPQLKRSRWKFSIPIKYKLY